MPHSSTSRALVLGGGSVAGIAWETGFLAGLADSGVDVLGADLVVGTSGGATVAAQVTSAATLSELLALQLDPSASVEPEVDVDIPALIERIHGILFAGDEPVVARRRLGELALEADRVPEAERRAIIEARLPDRQWPDQLLKLTAIDAATGELVVFDKHSGVELVDAVAASCAIPVVWPAATIAGRRYYDGGMRSTVNADVAQHYGRVLVLEPMTLPEMDDVAPLGEDSRPLVVRLDEASVAALGDNPLDPATRPACARAGYDQALRAAEHVGRFWAVK
jgi:NTE family protein